MATFFEIPLLPTPQQMIITLNSVKYTLTFIYRATPDGSGGWVMDIGDVNNNPLACGLPLVTGADLLGQLQYYGFGGGMAIANDGGLDQPPGFTDLGVNTHLYFVLYGGTQAVAVTVPPSRSSVPAVDSSGNPLMDSAGNPLYILE